MKYTKSIKISITDDFLKHIDKREFLSSFLIIKKFRNIMLNKFIKGKTLYNNKEIIHIENKKSNILKWNGHHYVYVFIWEDIEILTYSSVETDNKIKEIKKKNRDFNIYKKKLKNHLDFWFKWECEKVKITEHALKRSIERLWLSKRNISLLFLELYYTYIERDKQKLWNDIIMNKWANKNTLSLEWYHNIFIFTRNKDWYFTIITYINQFLWQYEQNTNNSKK